MKKLLILSLLISQVSHANFESAHADHKSWGGFWWSMRNAELALGWKGKHNRGQFTPAQVQEFTYCLTAKSNDCKNLINKYSKNNGISLSPLMKFDLFMKRYVEETYGENAPLEYYSQAAQRELEIHYINNDPNHKHYKSKAFAGKCIGWALSTFDYDEPTQVKTIKGIDFTPADIKGILANIYNGAQFFVNGLVYGTEYRDQGKESLAYKDVTPLQFIYGLRETIGKGKFLEADLDPGFGVWNYPIHQYEMQFKRDLIYPSQVHVDIKIEFANDEVPIDAVFSNQEKRADMKTRTYTATLVVPQDWDGDLLTATSSNWTGKSVNNHPDVIILGMEKNWKKEILNYQDDPKMLTEVNFELLKSHTYDPDYDFYDEDEDIFFEPIDESYFVVDKLINEYFSQD